MNTDSLSSQLLAISSVLAVVAGLIALAVAFFLVVKVLRWIDTGDSKAPRGVAYWWEDSRTGKREYYNRKGERI